MNHANCLHQRLALLAAVFATFWTGAYAFQTPSREPLPDIDLRRAPAVTGEAPTSLQAAAVGAFQTWVPDIKVDFDSLSGSPRSIASTTAFLTGPAGEGYGVSAATLAKIAADDPYRTVKLFLTERAQLFGYGAEALDSARLARDYTTPHNGMRTVVWEQQAQGIRIYDAQLVANTTKAGELINISSLFIPNPAQAALAGTPASAALLQQPPISARQALALAAQNIGVAINEQDLLPQSNVEPGPEQRQLYRGPGLKGDAEAKFMWLAMDASTLRLCWDTIVMSRERGEMFRIFVDVSNGQVLLRRCLTRYLTDASYRVWTSDSPSPFSPGYPTPVTTQPPLVSRTLVTLSALDTNASPAGWIPDGGNETLGNNVDAHTDWNADNIPDLPRPHGSPFRVFDFPVNLATQDPTTYSNVAVVQLFYLCNYYHDRLYELGFTEAAGNFQSNNFGRGGLGNDPVQADAQDGSGFNNANFSTPPDGSSGRMQMYIFTGPTPRRDGDLDAEVVFHEHTHGLSWRMVAGGQMLGTLQSDGMGEGWSDWYGLCLLSEAGDDVNGNYAAGAYVSYKLTATFLQNYYYGIRRYPYTTDMTKNPLTFKDIDPGQADFCSSGAPYSPAMGTCSAGNASEVHNQGEVWCVTLWEVRANLVNKFGWAVGNQLAMQIVTDAMRITPAHPNFLQARDAIVQADLVDNGGANRNELWAAFAKRGMGASATSPASSTTTGVHEAFDIPDNLQVIPGTGLASSGQIGGPFTPSCQAYTLRNNGIAALPWVAWVTQPWVSASPTSGTLTGDSNTVNVCLTDAANSLAPGTYSANVFFSNTVTHVAQVRPVALYVSPPRALYFPLDIDPGWTHTGQWAFGRPTGGGGTAYGFHDPTSGFTGSNVFGVNLNGDYSVAVGGPYYLTTGPLNLAGYTGVTLQFKRWLNADYPPYVYETIDVFNGSVWSSVWSNTAGVPISDTAWTNVAYNISARADGRTNVMIRWGHRVGQTGAFAYSGWNIDDIELLGTPVRAIALSMPTNATEGDGVLAGAGVVTINSAVPTNVVVALSSSDTNSVTVPASVVVPAGQTNAVFDITILDNNVLDGTRNVTVTAAVPAYASGRATITIYDNETSTLQVLLPASVVGSPRTIQGTLLSSGMPAANFTVSLTSSDTTEIQVPPTVILPAGQTSVVFNVTVLDDGRIDGPESVTVTAHVPGWTDGSTNIVVLDSENLNLAVSLPAMATEGAGLLANAGHVSISGTLPTNLVVTLTSSNLTEVVPSATATITAGQVTANFDLLIGHDPAVTGPLSVAINADAPGFVSGLSTILILDYESPPLPTNPVPANFATNIPASTSLAWGGGSGDVTNDVYFGTNAVPGPGQLQGSTTGLSWTLPLLGPNTTYYWQIVSHRGGTTPGPVWQFTTRGVDHFVWADIPSPQWLGIPFNVSVTAQDELGRTVSNFPGPVNLSGWVAGSGGSSNTILGNLPPSLISSGDFTLAFAFTPNTNITVTHVRSFSGTKVSLWTDGGTLVTSQNVSGPAGTWTDTPLTNPVPLTAGTTYRVGFYTSGGTYYYSTNRPFTFPNGTLVNGYYYNGGDSFPSIFYGSNRVAFLCDVRYTVGAAGPVPITPTISGPFVNGTWTGDLAVQHVAPSMWLRADDALGHTGASSNFTVSVQNDLSISASDTPDPVAIGGLWTNTLVLSNTGPLSATGVFITNVFPASAAFSFATADQGTYSVSGNQVVFAVGTMAGGATASFQVVSAPGTPGILTNSAVVTRAETDGDPSNNTAVNTAVALMPTLSINNVSLTEGNSGWKPFLFTVSLQPPTPNEVWASFTTVDGTATAGSDYVARSGLVKLAPYQTNETILIYVLGDTNIEPDETFSVVLSEPVNAALGTAVGIGTIINDDFPPGPMIGYLRSTAGLPWGSAANEATLTQVFGTNWEDLRYETVSNVGALFSGSKKFIFMEGGDIDANAMGLFLTNNLGVISNWVAAGGSLFVNAAPNQGANITLGFGALLTYPDYCSTATAVYPTHPIFNGPYMPVGTTWSGSYFGHATVSGPELIPLIADNATSHLELAERSYGAGHLMFGGMTLPIFHTPTVESSNLLANILFYGANISGAGSNLPPIIFAQPASVTALVGTSASFSITAYGSPPLSYYWQRNGTFIAGATDATYTTNNVQLSDSGAVFSCLVSNAFGTTLSSNAVLTVIPGTPPSITAQPASITVAVGGIASFSVGASGSPTLSYFWQRNGVFIPGATASFYSTNNVQLSDSGTQFSCLVSNAYGTALSSNATLTVIVAPTPVFLAGSYVYLPIDTNGVFMANSTGGKYNPAGTGGASGIDFWWPGTPVYNYVIGVGGVDYVNGAFQSLTLTNASAGGLQRAIIDANVTTSLHLRRDISFANNSKAIKIVDTLQNTGGTTLNNVVRLDTTDPDQDSVTNSTYTTLNDVVSIGLPNDMVVATGPLTGLSLGFGSDSGTQIPSAIGFNNTDAYSYLTVVDPNGASADIDINLAQNYGSLAPGITTTSVWYLVFGSSKFEVTNLFAQLVATNLAPLIVAQPANLTLTEGNTATFNISALGSLPLSYLWQRNGLPIPGATDATYSTNNVQVADSGAQFSCLVTNAYGVALSSNAVLTVLPGVPAAITMQPASITVAVGGTASFSVGASGTPPLSYSWQRNGLPIAGATSSFYSTNNVALADSGTQFSCLVSNAFGTALSSNATLTVFNPPGPVFLTGNYLYLPINSNGVFIANSTGGKYNSAGTGGASGVDFWWPGTPIYNYAIGVAGVSYANGVFQSLSLTNLSGGGIQRALIDANVIAGLHFTRDISFATNSKSIRIVDTLQNTGATALANVVSLDSTDPDQDSLAYGTYSTLNDVVSIGVPNDMVVATGPYSGLSLGFGSDSALQVPSAIGFNNTNPYDFLTVVDPNGTSADIAINLAQNFGQLNPGASKSVVWYMVFGDSKNEVTNAFALLVSTNAAPLITTQPVSQTVTQNTTATFFVTAIGSPPLSYAWFHNGTAIAGATSTGYTFGPAQLADSGSQFYCIVTNGFGASTSSVATLTVVPPALAHFTWSSIASPQTVGVPFAANLTARDSSEVIVTNFNGSVSVSASVGLPGATNRMFDGVAPQASASGTYTLGFRFTPNTNLTATHVRHIFGNKVSIWTPGGVLLAAQPVVSSNGYWLETALPTPLPLVAGSNYVLGVYVSANTYYWVTNLAGAFADGAVNASVYTNADGFPGLTTGGAWPLVGLRYTVGSSTPVPVTPVSAGPFVNGVWTGYITVSQAASNVVLVANDGAGHIGTSVPFIVAPGLSFSRMWLGAAGDAHIEISGTPGRVYQIQASTNLVDWQPISVITNITGVVPFVDPGATNYTQRFYRCVEQ